MSTQRPENSHKIKRVNTLKPSTPIDMFSASAFLLDVCGQGTQGSLIQGILKGEVSLYH
jgi:hypothetical protein